MREGWEYKRLGELCDIVMGQSPMGNSINENNGIEFHQGKTNFGDKFLMESGIYTTSPIRIAEKKTILLCVRAPVGIINITERQVCIGRGLSSLKPRLGLELLYLYYCLLSKHNYFESNSTGSTFKAISSKIINNTIIQFPPKPTQLSIVSELDKLNELIRIKKEQLKDYDALAQSIFYEMFGDPVVNEKGWEVKKLGEVSIYPKERIAIDQICPNQYIGVENLIKDRGGVRFSDNLPKADVAIAYKENDILLGNIRPYLKKIWLADKVGGASGDVVIIRIKERLISPLFLFKLLSSDQFFEYDNNHTKGAKMPRGDRKTIAKFGVILPPLSLQQSFAHKIEQIECQKAEVQKTITDLETLLAARMQYWFD